MNRFNAVLLICLAFAIALSFSLVSQKPLYVDENTHFYTISNFCKFNFSYPNFLTTIPGYHFFGGFFGWLTSCTELWIRIFNLLVAGASFVVFYKITQQLKVKNGLEKFLLFTFLPILFPFFFLIYTDVLSLLFVLLMFYFSTRENHILGGVFGLLGFVVRQNNIIWVAFVIAYLFSGGEDRKKWISLNNIKRMAPYIVVFIIAIGFFMKNGGFSLGDKAQHPTFFLGPMNVFTALFFFFWINLPENIFNLKRAAFRIKNLDRRVLISLVLGVVLFFAFFLLTFRVDHPYNSYDIYSYFLRNKILHLFDSSLLLRFAFFVIVALSILSLWVTNLKEKGQRLIYPFSLIFLSMSWLIETRYFIITYVLFNLFALREKKIERYLIVWYMVVTVGYMYLFLTNWTFW